MCTQCLHILQMLHFHKMKRVFQSPCRTHSTSLLEEKGQEKKMEVAVSSFTNIPVKGRYILELKNKV